MMVKKHKLKLRNFMERALCIKAMKELECKQDQDIKFTFSFNNNYQLLSNLSKWDILKTYPTIIGIKNIKSPA